MCPCGPMSQHDRHRFRLLETVAGRRKVGRTWIHHHNMMLVQTRVKLTTKVQVQVHLYLLLSFIRLHRQEMSKSPLQDTDSLMLDISFKEKGLKAVGKGLMNPKCTVNNVVTHYTLLYHWLGIWNYYSVFLFEFTVFCKGSFF